MRRQRVILGTEPLEAQLEVEVPRVVMPTIVHQEVVAVEMLVQTHLLKGQEQPPHVLPQAIFLEQLLVHQRQVVRTPLLRQEVLVQTIMFLLEPIAQAVQILQIPLLVERIRLHREQRHQVVQIRGALRLQGIIIRRVQGRQLRLERIQHQTEVIRQLLQIQEQLRLVEQTLLLDQLGLLVLQAEHTINLVLPEQRLLLEVTLLPEQILVLVHLLEHIIRLVEQILDRLRRLEHIVTLRDLVRQVHLEVQHQVGQIHEVLPQQKTTQVPQEAQVHRVQEVQQEGSSNN